MKTVFRVGMKVYDQVFEPDINGEVLDVNTEIPHHPITVLFGHNTCYYTAEGCRGQHKIRTLSTSPYTIQGFEQKAPAPEFHEALSWLDNNENYQTVFEDERTYPSKEIYKAFEGLRKLIILRDYYNEGWKPEWKDGTYKFSIYVDEDKFVGGLHMSSNRAMLFKTEEIRDRFFEEQKELLEIAKPLL